MKTVWWIGIVAVAAACAGSPRMGNDVAGRAVEGRYTGRLQVGSQRFEAAFDLVGDRSGSVRGSFSVQEPLAVDGSVRGTVIDDLLRITLSYDSGAGDGAANCNGRIEGILDVSAGGAVVDGPVTITDCGNEQAGRLSFRRAPTSR